MFFHNGNIFGTGLLYASVILCYNLFGMFVTQYTSAVLRTILEGLRCACIWVTNLFIFYVVLGPNPRFGEIWSDWSYLQLCGFLFLLLGMFVYNGIVRVEGMYYIDKDPFRCPIPAKMALNKDLAPYANDKQFVEDMKQYQGRQRATALKDAVMQVLGNDPMKLQTLESMVGITPEMIAMAHQQWAKDEAEAARMGDSVVEVRPSQG